METSTTIDISILDSLKSLPLEIKYLAVVESALNPSAKSRVGAKGLWQFMFTTGKIYGLESLRANIEDAEHNTTRFLIMSKELIFLFLIMAIG